MDWQTTFQNAVSSLAAWATNTGVKILVALLVLFVSFRIINSIGRKFLKKGEENHLDKTLTNTLVYAAKILLKIIVVICLVGYLGIDTSGLTALITSLGVCVGLAVNGTLSNLAGGVMIIITRPFRLDDYIEACGYSGTVEDIHITMTKLRTPDNKVVYIPNGTLSTSSVINYSMKDTRRVDFTFSIGYSADFEKARTILESICNAHELVLKDPAPMVRMSAHSASSIDIVTRVWVKSADYWTVNFDILEAVKREFDANGIEIPFNQLDVHVKND